MRKNKEVNTESVKIIPLGGLEQIGMNMTAFQYGDSILVVDCGMAFPNEDMHGIDMVIPDITFLQDHAEQVKGIMITHGHEDHIGALPYVLKELNVPIYATKLTMGILERKLTEHGLMEVTERHVVAHGDTVTAGDFKVEFVCINHSIADASALAIFSPAGTIVHTGDFKIDYTPIYGDMADLARLAELGRQGVLALLCDSTNATRPGFTSSERTVGKTFDSIFLDNMKKRIIVATFASNVDRVQQIIHCAEKYGRKVVVDGRSMINIVGTANELGYLNMKPETLIDIENMKNYPDEQIVLITTGSQGESMAALSRMAASIHRKVSIGANDAIVLSSNPIPGNEKAVSKIINELQMLGAKVIFQDTHVSGHACQEEIKLMYSLVRPRYAIPVHGEYHHRIAQAELVETLGIPGENIYMLFSGDVLELSEERAAVIGEVSSGGVLVDGLGVGDIGNIVLRDRHNLAENGIVIVVMTVHGQSMEVLVGPEIISRGFIYMKESDELIGEMKEVINSTVERCQERNFGEWSRWKSQIRDNLGDFLWKKMKRSPIILPIIMEVE